MPTSVTAIATAPQPGRCGREPTDAPIASADASSAASAHELEKRGAGERERRSEIRQLGAVRGDESRAEESVGERETRGARQARRPPKKGEADRKTEEAGGEHPGPWLREEPLGAARRGLRSEKRERQARADRKSRSIERDQDEGQSEDERQSDTPAARPESRRRLGRSVPRRAPRGPRPPREAGRGAVGSHRLPARGGTRPDRGPGRKPAPRRAASAPTHTTPVNGGWPAMPQWTSSKRVAVQRASSVPAGRDLGNPRRSVSPPGEGVAARIRERDPRSGGRLAHAPGGRSVKSRCALDGDAAASKETGRSPGCRRGPGRAAARSATTSSSARRSSGRNGAAAGARCGSENHPSSQASAGAASEESRGQRRYVQRRLRQSRERQIHSPLSGGLDRLGIAGVGVPHDARPGVAREDAAEAARRALRAVRDDDHAGMDRVPDADAAAVVDRDPGRAARPC